MNALVSQESDAVQDEQRKKEALKSQKLAYMLGIDEVGNNVTPSRRPSKHAKRMNSDPDMKEGEEEFHKLMRKNKSSGSLPQLNLDEVCLFLRFRQSGLN